MKTRHIMGFGAVLLASLFCAGCSESKASTGMGQAYATPQAAVDALRAALKKGDDAALNAVFGDGFRKLTAATDAKDEAIRRSAVSVAVDEKVELEDVNSDTKVVLIGADGWPLPAPLVKTDAGWRFDVAIALEEIRNRRIGANELTAIAVCRSFLEAEQEYALADRDGDEVVELAMQIRSSDGKQDGLYWSADVVAGETPSPWGPLLAAAEAGADGKPFHGYHFKVLTSQGKNATGGAMDYVENGNMTKGCALLAWPASHGDSGIMTFLVSHHGTVYQKDLGADTAKLAAKITAFDPGEAWKKVE